MAELTETGLVTSVDLMASYNEADAENVDILEKKVDHFEDALGTYLVKLSSEKAFPEGQPDTFHDPALHRRFRTNFRSYRQHHEGCKRDA